MKLTFTSLLATSAALAGAQFNNDVVHTRTLNGAPGSTLTVTNTFPTKIEFSETNIENTTATPYANQHNWNLSPNGLADATFTPTNSWSLSFNLDLSATGPTTLNKEAGFWIGKSDGTNPGQFIVKSNGEIAQFGGSLVFHEFHTPNSAGDYLLGTSILMSMAYDGTTGKLTSSETYNGITQTFTDATTLTTGYTVGGYGLYAVDTTGVSNTGDAVFTNIAAAPEPVSMAVLGFGALALFRRRKSS